jgi:hypothetical protein
MYILFVSLSSFSCFKSDKFYASGGGIYGTPGFIGCMRRITIDGQYKMPIDWRGEEISNPEDILVDSCQMHDRYYFVDYRIRYSVPVLG